MLTNSIQKIVLCCFFSLCFSTPLLALKWEDNLNKSLTPFAKKLAKNNGMEFLTTGLGSLVDSYDVIWCISLIDHRSMTIDQARPIVVSLIHEYLNKMYQDPVFAIYMKERAKTHRTYTADLTPKLIGFKIAYWDQNVDRPLHPYLAQVRVVDGVIQYYYADPKTQALQNPPTIETFEEAEKMQGQKGLS